MTYLQFVMRVSTIITQNQQGMCSSLFDCPLTSLLLLFCLWITNVRSLGQKFYLQPKKASRLAELIDEVCLWLPLRFNTMDSITPTQSHIAILITPFHSTSQHPLPQCRAYSDHISKVAVTLAYVTCTKLTLQASLHDLTSLSFKKYQTHPKLAKKRFMSNLNGK